MKERIDNIRCILEKGDCIKLDEAYGAKIGGMEGTVLEVMRYKGCESGFMIKTDINFKFLDANWFIKIKSK